MKMDIICVKVGPFKIGMVGTSKDFTPWANTRVSPWT